MKTELTDNERQAVVVTDFSEFGSNAEWDRSSLLRWNTTAGLGILSQSRSCSSSSGSSALGCCEGWSTRKTVRTRYLSDQNDTTNIAVLQLAVLQAQIDDDSFYFVTCSVL